MSLNIENLAFSSFKTLNKYNNKTQKMQSKLPERTIADNAEMVAAALKSPFNLALYLYCLQNVPADPVYRKVGKELTHAYIRGTHYPKKREMLNYYDELVTGMSYDNKINHLMDGLMESVDNSECLLLLKALYQLENYDVARCRIAISEQEKVYITRPDYFLTF